MIRWRTWTCHWGFSFTANMHSSGISYQSYSAYLLVRVSTAATSKLYSWASLSSSEALSTNTIYEARKIMIYGNNIVERGRGFNIIAWLPDSLISTFPWRCSSNPITWSASTSIFSGRLQWTNVPRNTFMLCEMTLHASKAKREGSL